VGGHTGKQRPTFSSDAVRKVTLNGCYGINTNDNNITGVYTRYRMYTYILLYIYTYTYIYIYMAIASRQPRSSVPAAIYIVFIALRAVSIHFYHCFTAVQYIYTFPIYTQTLYYIIYILLLLLLLLFPLLYVLYTQSV